MQRCPGTRHAHVAVEHLELSHTLSSKESRTPPQALRSDVALSLVPRRKRPRATAPLQLCQLAVVIVVLDKGPLTVLLALHGTDRTVTSLEQLFVAGNAGSNLSLLAAAHVEHNGIGALPPTP